MLPARLDRYDPSMLDMICLAGEAGWARLSPAPRSGQPGAQPGAGDADRAVPARARGRVAGAADRRRRSRRSATTARRVLSVLRSRGASFFARSRASLRARRRSAAACDRRAGRLRAGDVGRILRTARAGVGGARTPGAARSPQQLRRPVDGHRGRRRGRHARRGGRAPGVDAAPPLRRRVPAAAHPRDERRDLARARARLPASRGARRDPQRPVRDRHVGRAVRASGRRRTAARGAAHPGRRRAGHHQRRRSVEPRRDRHRRANGSGPPAATGSSIATACRSPSSKAASCASWRRSTRASPPTCRARSRPGP